MKNYFVDHVTALIDSGKKVTHEHLAEGLEKLHADEKRRERIKAPIEVIIQYEYRSTGNLLNGVILRLFSPAASTT